MRAEYGVARPPPDDAGVPPSRDAGVDPMDELTRPIAKYGVTRPPLFPPSSASAAAPSASAKKPIK